MSQKLPRIPSLCVHKSRNLAYVRLGTQMIYLGPPDSNESRQRYEQIIAEWLQAGRVYVKPADRQGISVNEVLLAYRQHAATYYVNPDGTPTPEIERVNLAFRTVMDLYGLTPAFQFGPKALVAVREKMVGNGLARMTVNQRTNVVRRAFKWAARQELIPASVYHGLQTVDGLRRGRTQATESVPVKPIADTIVDIVSKRLSPTLRTMVALHNLTGMRSGELVIMRTADIDMSNDQVWTYKPTKHKTQNHGHERVVQLGPKAQELIRPYLSTDLSAFLFSPVRAREERYAAKRTARKSPVQPSQVSRKKDRPKKSPGARYTTASYRRALRLCLKTVVEGNERSSPTVAFHGN